MSVFNDYCLGPQILEVDMSAEQHSVSWNKATVVYVLLILAGCAMVAAHVLDDHIPLAAAPQSGGLAFDMTPPYWLIVGWGLFLLFFFAVSTYETDFESGGGSRAFFRLAGGATLLYTVLLALGDWSAIGRVCARGESPDDLGFGPSCYPADWVHWTELQLLLHVAVCVLLIIAFHYAALTWRQLRVRTVEDRTLQPPPSPADSAVQLLDAMHWRPETQWPNGSDSLEVSHPDSPAEAPGTTRDSWLGEWAPFAPLPAECREASANSAIECTTQQRPRFQDCPICGEYVFLQDDGTCPACHGSSAYHIP